MAFSLVLLITLTGCSPPTGPVIAETLAPGLSDTRTAPPGATSLPGPAPSQTPRPSATHTPTSAPSATSILTASPTEPPTNTPTITPTPGRLRGVVHTHAQCRYGPGWPYLYRYGLLVGNRMEIIGRNELGTWIEVQAIGADIYGGEPCWVRADLLNLAGDVLSVAPVDFKLPFSLRYPPPAAVSADRRGDEVVLYWDRVRINPGDDSGQYPYLIEAWVCREGRLIFDPVGSWETSYTIIDQAGCSEASHARIYSVEKHGYSQWREIPWPTHP